MSAEVWSLVFRTAAELAAPKPGGPRRGKIGGKAASRLEGRDVMELSERIRAARQARGITLIGLAEETGIPARHLSCYETGRLTPSVEMVMKLAEVLDVSLDHLLTGDGPRGRLSAEDQIFLERLERARQLPADDKAFLLELLDGLLAKNGLEPFGAGWE